MLQVNKQADYGLLLLEALASHYHNGGYVSLRYISEKRKLPYRFLGKIITPLKKFRIVESREGVSGGYRLARDPQKIPIREVLLALGEDLDLVQCAQGDEECPRFCQCHSKKFWQKLQVHIDSYLSHYTVADLMDEWPRKKELPNVNFKNLDPLKTPSLC